MKSLNCPGWHVFNGITQFYVPPTRLSTCGMNHLALLPSRTASSPFGQYSFPVPLRVGGRVGLGGLIDIPGWYALRRRSPIPVPTAPDAQRPCGCNQRCYRYSTPPLVRTAVCTIFAATFENVRYLTNLPTPIEHTSFKIIRYAYLYAYTTFIF